MSRYLGTGWRLSIVLGGLYFATLPYQPYTGSVAVKGLSIATLSVLAWTGGARWLSLGLAASSLGDVLLDAGPEKLFVPGLVAFLVAHVLYTVLFLRRRPLVFSTGRSMLAAASVLYALVFAWWLAPGLGSLRVPVAVYICVITGMVDSALYASVPREDPLRSVPLPGL